MNEVMVAMPSRRVPNPHAFAAAAAAAMEARAAFCYPAIEPREKARNRICATFLDDDHKFEWLLFVDDDTVIPRDAVAALRAVDQPIVSGVQPLFLKGALVANVKEGSLGDESPWPAWPSYDRTEPYQIRWCGFGCVLIHRPVIAAMEFPWFREHYGDRNGHGHITEDIWFCDRATQMGFDIWCNPAVRCGHLKELDMAEWVPMTIVNRLNGGQGE